MFFIYVAILLIILYFFINGFKEIPLRVILSITFFILYTLLLFVIPPELKYMNAKIGRLYTIVPLVSFGAILFPNLNTKIPEKMMVFLGGLGLVSVMGILLFFKFIYQ